MMTGKTLQTENPPLGGVALSGLLGVPLSDVPQAFELNYTMRLKNIGYAAMKVSGDMPALGAVIVFGSGLKAVVVDGDRNKRRVDVLLMNPESIVTGP